MAEVPRRRLGDSDLEVSEISLGSWLTYAGGVERDQTEACTRAAFEAGINFFDTANVYGRQAGKGATERIVGNWFATGGDRRERTVIATKVYGPMSDWPNENHLSARPELLNLGRQFRKCCAIHLERRNQTRHMVPSFIHRQQISGLSRLINSDDITRSLPANHSIDICL